jgi:hypothetical protein
LFIKNQWLGSPKKVRSPKLGDAVQSGEVAQVSNLLTCAAWEAGQEIDRAQRRRAAVAQVSNLLYRRLPVGRVLAKPATRQTRGACGLEIRDTADWKSALRLKVAALQSALGFRISFDIRIPGVRI